MPLRPLLKLRSASSLAQSLRTAPRRNQPAAVAQNEAEEALLSAPDVGTALAAVPRSAVTANTIRLAERRSVLRRGE